MVINRGSQRYYIQSAFIMPTDSKERQESNSLLNIDDAFKKNNNSQGLYKTKEEPVGYNNNWSY